VKKRRRRRSEEEGHFFFCAAVARVKETKKCTCFLSFSPSSFLHVCGGSRESVRMRMKRVRYCERERERERRKGILRDFCSWWGGKSSRRGERKGRQKGWGRLLLDRPPLLLRFPPLSCLPIERRERIYT
jgi:hypothetical protein